MNHLLLNGLYIDIVVTKATDPITQGSQHFRSPQGSSYESWKPKHWKMKLEDYKMRRKNVWNVWRPWMLRQEGRRRYQSTWGFVGDEILSQLYGDYKKLYIIWGSLLNKQDSMESKFFFFFSWPSFFCCQDVGCCCFFSLGRDQPWSAIAQTSTNRIIKNLMKLVLEVKVMMHVGWRCCSFFLWVGDVGCWVFGIGKATFVLGYLLQGPRDDFEILFGSFRFRKKRRFE